MEGMKKKKRVGGGGGFSFLLKIFKALRFRLTLNDHMKPEKCHDVGFVSASFEIR